MSFESFPKELERKIDFPVNGVKIFLTSVSPSNVWLSTELESNHYAGRTVDARHPWTVRRIRCEHWFSMNCLRCEHLQISVENELSISFIATVVTSASSLTFSVIVSSRKMILSLPLQTFISRTWKMGKQFSYVIKYATLETRDCVRNNSSKASVVKHQFYWLLINFPKCLITKLPCQPSKRQLEN